MLSISARGSASPALSYYQHIAGDKSAAAAEDYYSHDEPGYYLGYGSDSLGLQGQVRADEFMDLAEGSTPLGDAQNAGKDDRRAGWDLTFSSPKSVSISWALADESTRQKVQAAHDQAVARSIEFIEQHAAYTRRGSGSISADEDRREKIGLVVAGYRHGTSREQDPQLHTHAFVFNVAPRQDGTVGAIDSRPLYEWRSAAGAVYSAELAQNLQRLGYTVEKDGREFRVTEVPKALETEFSTRRAQIEKAMAEHGSRGAKAAEIATLDTRRAKVEIDRETLLQNWQTRSHEIAPEWSPRDAQATTVEPHAITAAEVKPVQAELTRENSTLSAPQLYAQVGIDRIGKGGADQIEKSVKTVAADQETVRLEGKRGETRYTTRDQQQLEHEMVDRAKELADTKSHAVSAQKLAAAIESRPTLTDEQKEAVQHIVNGPDIACIQGSAGAGKSFALGAAREAWEAEGYRVRGAALSGKAAQELQNGSGIESTTLTRLEGATRGYTDDAGKFHEPTDKLTARDIVVVDEAGMVGSRKMASLVADARTAGAKVVLVGDTRQLQAIAAGAAFRAIQERVGHASIDTIQRQTQELDRQAVRDLRDGRADRALENLSERDRVHQTENARTAKQEAGQAVAADLGEGKLSLALTATRAEARDVNEAARAAARDRGLVTGKDVAVSTPAGERSFAIGDRVLFTRNNRDLDVKNGDLGRITSAERDEFGQAHLSVALDRGGMREINAATYQHLNHGYAVTVHKSQGSTVDRAHVVASENGYSSREWAYVAGSRGREATHIHADKHTLAEIAPQWARARQKDVTLDYRPDRTRESSGHGLTIEWHHARHETGIEH